MTDYDSTFKGHLYPATDLFIAMKIVKRDEELSDGLRILINGMKKETMNTPSINKGALLGTIIHIVIDIINKQDVWIVKASVYKRHDIMEFYLKMFDVYLDYVNVSP